MTSTNSAANWAIGKRLLHWAIAVAVVIALLAPKPEEGEGLLHVAAGSTALALVLARLLWRLLGDVRPRLRSAFSLTLPNLARGPRGAAPLMIQIGRLIGFGFLAAIPIAAGLGLAGIGQGEDTPLLEAHEAAGTAIMALAIVHAVAIILFSLAIKYDLIGVTLSGPARSFSEGGARGTMGLALGAVAAMTTLAVIWGPFNLADKVAAASEQGERGDRGDAGEEVDED